MHFTVEASRTYSKPFDRAGKARVVDRESRARAISRYELEEALTSMSSPSSEPSKSRR